MAELKLYCASLSNCKDSTITYQTTHVIARTPEEAYKKSCNVFESTYKDTFIKTLVSCIELGEVDGHKICIA